MIVEKDVPILMADGVVLRANVFRPEGIGPFPVIMSLGIYSKDIHFADGYAPQWGVLTRLTRAWRRRAAAAAGCAGKCQTPSVSCRMASRW